MPAHAIQFEPLADSDVIRQRASESFPPRDELQRFVGGYPFLHKQIADRKCPKPILGAGAAAAYVILHDSHKVGVLRLPAETINARWPELLEVMPDGFVIVEQNFANKYVIDWYPDPATGLDTCDIAAWGYDWAVALKEFGL